MEHSSNTLPYFGAWPAMFPWAMFSLNSTIQPTKVLGSLDSIHWNQSELVLYFWNTFCVGVLKFKSIKLNIVSKKINICKFCDLIWVPFIWVKNIWTNMPFGANWCNTQRMNWWATDCDPPGRWVGFSYCHGNFTWLANLEFRKEKFEQYNRVEWINRNCNNFGLLWNNCKNFGQKWCGQGWLSMNKCI